MKQDYGLLDHGFRIYMLLLALRKACVSISLTLSVPEPTVMLIWRKEKGNSWTERKENTGNMKEKKRNGWNVKEEMEETNK
jgi:hypothetical protein